MIYNIPTVAAAAFQCSPGIGIICSLPAACSTYTSLWSYGFALQFSGQTNYLTVPLGAFAVDNGGKCQLMIEYLDGDQNAQSDQIILGSLFLQQYVNYWQYDTVAMTTTLSIEVSTNGALTGTYIGSAVYGNTLANPFTNFVGTAQTVVVNHDTIWMSTSVGANLGW